MNNFHIKISRHDESSLKRVAISNDCREVLSFQVDDTAPQAVYGFTTVWAPGLHFGNTLGRLLSPEADLASILNSIFPGNAVHL